MRPRPSSGIGRIRSDDQPHAVTVLPRSTGSVSQARTWLSTFLQENGVDNGVCLRALVIVSELVTNALQHGLGDVVVRVSLTPVEQLQVAVSDSGGGTPTVMPRDPLRVGGVGLRLVDQMADEWGISPFAGGKTVWVTLAPVPS